MPLTGGPHRGAHVDPYAPHAIQEFNDTEWETVSQRTNPAEDAVLSVLAGTTIEEAARRARTSPARLAESVALYHAAGQAALESQLAGWHQVYIEFADHPTADRAFRAHLLPTLRTKPVESWWFLRKHPCWRLRVSAPLTRGDLSGRLGS